jgi:hypothetical protein
LTRKTQRIVLCFGVNPDGTVKFVQQHKDHEPGRHGTFVKGSGHFSASKHRGEGVDPDDISGPVMDVEIEVLSNNQFRVSAGHGYLKRGYEVVRQGYGWTIKQKQMGTDD